jgi:hypothetical protein
VVARPLKLVERDRNAVVNRPAGRGASRTLAAVAHKTVFSWNGRSSGCFDFTSAATPAM